MTRDEILQRYPRASESFLRHNADDGAGTASSVPCRDAGDPYPIRSAEPELVICGEPETAVQDQKGDPGRYTVVIESRRRRLLDPDNLVGGVKFFLDSLRYFRVIPEDTTKAIKLVVFQTKVRDKTAEKTVIKVIPPK